MRQHHWLCICRDTICIQTVGAGITDNQLCAEVAYRVRGVRRVKSGITKLTCKEYRIFSRYRESKKWLMSC